MWWQGVYCEVRAHTHTLASTHTHRVVTNITLSLTSQLVKCQWTLDVWNGQKSGTFKPVVEGNYYFFYRDTDTYCIYSIAATGAFALQDTCWPPLSLGSWSSFPSAGQHASVESSESFCSFRSERCCFILYFDNCVFDSLSKHFTS